MSKLFVTMMQFQIYLFFFTVQNTGQEMTHEKKDGTTDWDPVPPSSGIHVQHDPLAGETNRILLQNQQPTRIWKAQVESM